MENLLYCKTYTESMGEPFLLLDVTRMEEEPFLLLNALRAMVTMGIVPIKVLHKHHRRNQNGRITLSTKIAWKGSSSKQTKTGSVKKYEEKLHDNYVYWPARVNERGRRQ